MRLNVIELTDEARDALIAAGNNARTTAPYNLGDALAALSPTAPPAITLIALRRIAEGAGAAAGWAREALEVIGDRVSPDAEEGPPDAATLRARDHADAQGGGDFG